MMIVADYRLPVEALRNLGKMGEVVLFKTQNLVYKAVSGHPDLFLCPTDSGIIYAPNIPPEILNMLFSNTLKLIKGEKKVGFAYPETSAYNCVISENYLLHKAGLTDKALCDHLADKKLIDVKQGYARCTTLALQGNRFLTSDRGIRKKLDSMNLEVLFVSGNEILLPGLEHGFIGGACGMYGNKVILCGSLDYHPQKEEIVCFIEKCGCEPVELYSGPLFDGGGILFLE